MFQSLLLFQKECEILWSRKERQADDDSAKQQQNERLRRRGKSPSYRRESLRLERFDGGGNRTEEVYRRGGMSIQGEQLRTRML